MISERVRLSTRRRGLQATYAEALAAAPPFIFSFLGTFNLSSRPGLSPKSIRSVQLPHTILTRLSTACFQNRRSLSQDLISGDLTLSESFSSLSGTPTTALRRRTPFLARSTETMATVQSTPQLQGVEAAKRAAAYQAVAEHFSPEFKYVGIGSGTTIKYVVDAIRDACAATGAHENIFFIPTGYQSRMEIESRGLISLKFDSLAPNRVLDVAFDGADEVDEDLNCIKGGGACLFQEKLVAMRAKKFICVADYRKDVSRLLTGWSYIPIEVAPIAAHSVLQALRDLGSPDPQIRLEGDQKIGPLKTDQDFFIIKAPFPTLTLATDKSEAGATGKTMDGQTGRVWEVNELAAKIKAIQGVLDVGLFVGLNGPDAKAAGLQGGQKPVAVYFGMADGTVKKRTAP